MVFRRYGSTRLPGKGLKLIAGNSMIQLLMTIRGWLPAFLLDEGLTLLGSKRICLRKNP